MRFLPPPPSLAAAVIMGFLAPPAARGAGEGQILLWFPRASGDGAVILDSGQGEASVSIREDVSFRDRSLAPGFLFELGGSRLRGRFTLLHTDLDVRGEQTATVEAGDHAVTVRGPLTTAVDMLVMRGEVRFLAGGEQAWLGLLAGIQYARLDARLETAGAEFRVRDQEAAFPAAGVFAGVRPIPALSVQGEVVVSRFTWSDYDVKYLELSADARAHLGGGWYAGLGYRRIDADVHRGRDALRADASLSGPVVFTGFIW